MRHPIGRLSRAIARSSVVALALAIGLAKGAIGQIVPDDTLGAERSRVTPNVQVRGGAADRIEGGAARGETLFHSFRSFNVGDGQRVYFNNPAGIRNILGRVTGGDGSNILGTLGVEGGANLFLLNPNGIVFGSNARLDVRGSFLATTADRFRFADGSEFSATNPQAAPLLTVSAPIGLQFGANPGAIALNQSFLAVDPGQSLVLAGGNVTLDASFLAAQEGQIEVGGLAAADTVGLTSNGNQLGLTFPNQATRADVSLINGSNILMSAGNGGSVAIDARNLEILGGSQVGSLVLAGLGSAGSRAGDITLNSTGTIRVDQSTISSVVGRNAIGNAGAILINANALAIDGGSSNIFNSTGGQGNAGNIVVNARDRVSINAGNLSGSVFANAIGNAGDIHINTDSLTIDGATGSIFSSTGGQGNAGNIIIDARDRISINAGLLASSVFADAIGNAGDVRINTNVLTFNAGGIQTLTGGQGNAGNIVINARDRASFIGSLDFQNGTTVSRSLIATDVNPNAVGKAGTIRITTGDLTLNRFIMTSSTGGLGNSGDINIDVRDRFLINHSLITTEVVDNLTVGDQTISVGNATRRQGGNISIQTGSLEATGLSLLSTGTSGFGDAGDVTIHARDRVAFDGGGSIIENGDIRTGGISSTVSPGAVGQGGTIRINAGSLSLSNGAGLRTNVREADRGLPAGHGDAGDIIINARGNVQLQAGRTHLPSIIRSNIESGAQGNGGDIHINADSVFFRDGSQLNAETSGRGDAGNIIIRARDRVTFERNSRTAHSLAASTVEAGGVGQGGDIRISANSLFVRNGSQLLTETSGQGDAGNIIIHARDRVAFESRDQTAHSAALSAVSAGGIGRGGNIQIDSNTLSVTNGAQLQASLDRASGSLAAGRGRAGDITINARDQVIVSGNPRLSFTSIGSSILPGAIGRAGTVRLNTGSLTVTSGAQINSGTSGQGNGGRVVVNARDRITLDGSTAARNGGRFSSGIFTSVDPTGHGRGGAIQIDTNTLSLTRGARISASTRGDSGAGSVTINAGDRISIDGSQQIAPDGRLSGATSGIFSTTQNRGRNGGDVRITTDTLALTNRGTVNVRSLGRGNAGSITLDARRLQLDRGRISTEASASNGGNITVQNTDLLTLQNRSQITARSGSRQSGGNGGNINLEAGLIATTPTQNSDINANAFAGQGGNIQITHNQGIFGIAPRPEASPQTSDITASSALGIDGTVTINQPDVDPSRGLVTLPTVPIDATQQITSTCPTNSQQADRLGSFIISGRGGLPPSPTDLLSNDNILSEWVTPGESGNANVKAASPPETQAIVEAQGWVRDAQGKVRLVASSAPASPSAPCQSH